MSHVCKYFNRVNGELVCSVCGGPAHPAPPPLVIKLDHTPIEDKMDHRPIDNKSAKRKKRSLK
jgi:hypothetical protein